MVEWNHPPGPPGIILVAGDSSQPLLHHVLTDILRVDPSGILESRVHPHRMVTSLERLDTSTEEDLQRVLLCLELALVFPEEEGMMQ